MDTSNTVTVLMDTNKLLNKSVAFQIFCGSQNIIYVESLLLFQGQI